MSELGYEESLILKNRARENPAAHSHTEIKETFEAMDPMEATYARDDYAAIATAWEETITVFAARIRRSSESAWSGPAAETARQAIADYAADAMNLTPALWGLAYRVDNMVSAVLSTKNGMPEVVDDPQSWWVPGDWFDGDGGVAAAEQRAQQHMATTYVDPAVSVDAQVPVLPQPRDPVAVDDGGTPGGPTGDNGTSPAGTSPAPGTPGPEAPGAEQPGEQQPAGEDTTPGDTRSAATGNPATTPQSTVPSTTGSPAVTPASTTTGTPPGSPGSPGGPAGAPGPSAPAPGQTVPGSPSAGAPAATAGTRTASGSPAMRGGMPMMGAPGASRGSGDDERDRQTPDYLVNEENTRELLGEEPRTIPGGVLGADAPAAGPAERPPGY